MAVAPCNSASPIKAGVRAEVVVVPRNFVVCKVSDLITTSCETLPKSMSTKVKCLCLTGVLHTMHKIVPFPIYIYIMRGEA